MDWVRGVNAVLSNLNRDKKGLNADGQVSAAERGAEMLSPGLVPQLHRPDVFAPWNTVPGSLLARRRQQQRGAAGDHGSRKIVKIKGSCLLASVLFSCSELALTWPACGRAAAWNCWALLHASEDILTSSAAMAGRTGSSSSRVLVLRTAYRLLLWSCYHFPPEANTWQWWRTLILSFIGSCPCTPCWRGSFSISIATYNGVEPPAPALLPPVAQSAFSCSSCNRKAVLSLPVWTDHKTLGTWASCWAASGPPASPEGGFLQRVCVPWGEVVLCCFWQE